VARGSRITVDPDAKIHIEEVNDRLRRWLAGEITSDAVRIAPVDTGVMAENIAPAFDSHLVVAPYGGEEHNPDVPFYQEYGTENMPAQPFLRPAAYKRRRPPNDLMLRDELAGVTR
jgi:hypothetical protein